MNDITYVVGDVTRPFGHFINVSGPWDGPTAPVVVAHACNNGGGWGAGVSGAIGRRWPHAERAYREAWHRGELRPGQSQLVEITQWTYVANLVACHVVRRGPSAWKTRVDLDWLRYALAQLTGQMRDDVLGHEASVHMPRIGCGLAGGRWSDVEPHVRATLCDAGVRVYVYDLPGARDLERLRQVVRNE